jgi:pSer/pThr/pTyr-binding forkhead associated (FHA) protein
MQCQKTQPEGAIFCSECGNKLIDTSGLATQTFEPDNELLQTAEMPIEALVQGKHEIDIRVILQVMKSGEKLILAGQDDFTIGRMSEGQSIIPDIDLSPYNAYQEGVSRIHASIKVNGGVVNLIDLNSINGTSINDTKITPNIYYPLEEGDIITLGRMKLQVILKK